jgi:hypothetical protein
LPNKIKKLRKSTAKKSHDHEYHVVWNPTRRSWDVERDGGRSGQFAYDRDTAIGLAVREARNEASQGLDVVVCVQQKDGTFHLEWSSE